MNSDPSLLGPRRSAASPRLSALPLARLLALPLGLLSALGGPARANQQGPTPPPAPAAQVAPAAQPTSPSRPGQAAQSAQGGPGRPAGDLVTPGENLVVEGVPPIPRELQQRVGRYTEFRAAGLSDWHPVRRELLINTRFADVPQIHRVLMPGGARTQLTFFPDRVGGAVFEPTKGDYFLFGKDVGGGEWFQFYRYDVQSGEITLLTDGKSRNTSLVFSKKGDRIAYASTRQIGRAHV